MAGNIWVTGIGVVSSIGMNVEQSLVSLRAGKRGLGRITILETMHRSEFQVGEVNHTNLQLIELLQLPPEHYRIYSRTSLLGMIAALEAHRSAGINADDEVSTALVSATTVGGIDKTEQCYASGDDEPGFIRTHPCGDSTDKISDYLGLTGYRTTLSTACSSGANAVIHGARLIHHGIVDRAIVGGTDALSRFTLNGFNSLMILDRDCCRPFDRNRKGLNLGEGAGYLVLESDKITGGNTERRMCRLSGFANTNDAYHQTASSPGGEAAFRAMSGALSMGGTDAGEIGYINAHGTGTENNDASEGAALVRLFGDNLPPFSSTKSFTGHTLGAAAGVEAVFSVLALKYGLLFPNLGFSEPVEELGIVPVTEWKEGASIMHVLSNSFGFGGNNSTLVFSKE
jgi:3-oxoacyl-(acyl-carrier-protein) synthase